MLTRKQALNHRACGVLRHVETTSYAGKTAGSNAFMTCKACNTRIIKYSDEAAYRIKMKSVRSLLPLCSVLDNLEFAPSIET
jgi:hypothetical protein